MRNNIKLRKIGKHVNKEATLIFKMLMTLQPNWFAIWFDWRNHDFNGTNSYFQLQRYTISISELYVVQLISTKLNDKNLINSWGKSYTKQLTDVFDKVF